MREILFRGKRVDNGEWVYGHCFKGGLTADRVEGSKPEDGWYFLTGCQDRHFISQNGVVFEVIPETVGQDTGLKDKKGKKIFEGDVLHWDSHWGWYVGYENGSFRRIPLNDVQRINWKHHTLHQEELDTWEVIGNIHDKPELMEVSNEDWRN